MGWFDEQIKLRKQSDDDAFADSFVKMAGAVMGEKVLASLNDDRIVAKNEIDEYPEILPCKKQGGSGFH